MKNRCVWREKLNSGVINHSWMMLNFCRFGCFVHWSNLHSFILHLVSTCILFDFEWKNVSVTNMQKKKRKPLSGAGMKWQWKHLQDEPRGDDKCANSPPVQPRAAVCCRGRGLLGCEETLWQRDRLTRTHCCGAGTAYWWSEQTSHEQPCVAAARVSCVAPGNSQSAGFFNKSWAASFQSLAVLSGGCGRYRCCVTARRLQTWGVYQYLSGLY